MGPDKTDRVRCEAHRFVDTLGRCDGSAGGGLVGFSTPPSTSGGAPLSRGPGLRPLPRRRGRGWVASMIRRTPTLHSANSAETPAHLPAKRVSQKRRLPSWGPRAACPPTSAIEPTFAAHRLFLRGPYGPVVTGMTAWQAAGPKAFDDSLRNGEGSTLSLRRVRPVDGKTDRAARQSILLTRAPILRGILACCERRGLRRVSVQWGNGEMGRKSLFTFRWFA